MNCCPRPKAEGNSSSVHPQLRGVIVMTVTQEGLKQLFYYPTQTFIINFITDTYYIMTRLVVTLNVKTENMAETCLYPGFVVQITFACLICLFVYFIVFFFFFFFFFFFYFWVFFCKFCLFVWHLS